MVSPRDISKKKKKKMCRQLNNYTFLYISNIKPNATIATKAILFTNT